MRAEFAALLLLVFGMGGCAAAVPWYVCDPTYTDHLSGEPRIVCRPVTGDEIKVHEAPAPAPQPQHDRPGSVPRT